LHSLLYTSNCTMQFVGLNTVHSVQRTEYAQSTATTEKSFHLRFQHVWRDCKGARGMGHVSLKRLNAEGLKGGLLYWVPWVMKGRLWGRASLFMGAEMGNLEWACLLGTLRDG